MDLTVNLYICFKSITLDENWNSFIHCSNIDKDKNYP